MTTPQRNPFVRFYHALTAMERWPHWRFFGILVGSLMIVVGVILSIVTAQPSSKALYIALDNVLALWAIVFVPGANFVLVLLFSRRPFYLTWSVRLMAIGMIGILASALWGVLALNATFTPPWSRSALLSLLLASSYYVFAVGFILLMLRTKWRNWATVIWLVYMVALALTVSYQALANAEPAHAIPILNAMASSFQLVAYPLIGFVVIPTMLDASQTARSQVQTSPSS